MKLIKENDGAVSEILGTMLLLSIMVGIFGLVYINVFTYEFPTNQPRTQLSTTIQDELLIIEILRGNDLPVDSTINIDIDGVNHILLLKELMKENAKYDGKWNIGEQVIYNSGMDLTVKKVLVTIIDSTTSFTYHTGIIG